MNEKATRNLRLPAILARDKQLPARKSDAGITGRREFLRGVLRYMASGGVLGGVSLLAMQKKDPAALVGDCTQTIACGGCGAFGACDLPRALAARQRNGQAHG